HTRSLRDWSSDVCSSDLPISSYGITKLALEKYIAMYAMLAGIDYLILRPSNVYGEDQHLQNGQGVIGVLVDRALRSQVLEVWGKIGRASCREREWVWGGE